MNNLIVKNVDVLGDSIMAAKDDTGIIWVGVRWLCQGMGMTEGQHKRQIKNIQKDLLLKKGGSNLILNKCSGEREVFCLKLDYLPIWLAKINITPTMQKEHPELADKLLDYQLRAKDILAEAFMPKQRTTPKTSLELLELHYEAIKEVNGKVEQIRDEFEEFKQEIPVFGVELADINNVVKEKVHECLGGRESMAYQDKRLHKRLYRDIYGQTNRLFGVRKYKLIRRNQVEEYIKAVKEYVPPIGIQSLIDKANLQLNLDL